MRLAILCHALGTALPCAWHNFAMPLAQLCQVHGSMLAKYSAGSHAVILLFPYIHLFHAVVSHGRFQSVPRRKLVDVLLMGGRDGDFALAGTVVLACAAEDAHEIGHDGGYLSVRHTGEEAQEAAPAADGLGVVVVGAVRAALGEVLREVAADDGQGGGGHAAHDGMHAGLGCGAVGETVDVVAGHLVVA